MGGKDRAARCDRHSLVSKPKGRCCRRVGGMIAVQQGTKTHIEHRPECQGGTGSIRVKSSTCEFKFAHQCEGIYEYLRQKAEYCDALAYRMFNVRIGYPLKQAATVAVGGRGRML
eukprot:scaffold36848_cov49-Attheya_sp.AAC.1